jgi:hypothetical protein
MKKTRKKYKNLAVKRLKKRKIGTKRREKSELKCLK